MPKPSPTYRRRSISGDSGSSHLHATDIDAGSTVVVMNPMIRKKPVIAPKKSTGRRLPAEAQETHVEMMNMTSNPLIKGKVVGGQAVNPIAAVAMYYKRSKGSRRGPQAQSAGKKA